MKAFHFRLETAMQWRAAQLEAEKSRVAAAAVLAQGIKDESDNCRAELRRGALELTQGFTGHTPDAWPCYVTRLTRQIEDLGRRSTEADRNLNAAMQLMTEASRKLRLLEKLKRSDSANWNTELNRELEVFAGESYLARRNLRLQLEARTASRQNGRVAQVDRALAF